MYTSHVQGQSPLVEGSAFSAINPTVAEMRRMERSTGREQQLKPSAAQTIDRQSDDCQTRSCERTAAVLSVPTSGPAITFQAVADHAPPIIDNVVETEAPANAPQGKKRRDCGIVTIQNDQMGWKPKSTLDVPPSCCTGMTMEVAGLFALAFNQSAFARRRGRWALVSNRGTVLILCGIQSAERPLNPADFPSCVQSDLTFHEAETAARSQNGPRRVIASVPRQWTISLRRADAVNQWEGGADL